MKFPGTCVVCRQKILVNEIGLWAQGLGVKHERCDTTSTELQCIVCGATAGCSLCEFQDVCDIPNVSQLCICTKCSENNDAFGSYQKAANKKFPHLNS